MAPSPWRVHRLGADPLGIAGWLVGGLAGVTLVMAGKSTSALPYGSTLAQPGKPTPSVGPGKETIARRFGGSSPWLPGRINTLRTGRMVRYVNLETAPVWECVVLAILSITVMVWRCWTLFDPTTRLRSAAVMAVGMAAITCSVLPRRDSFGHGVELLVLAAASFGMASVGKLDALRAAAEQERDRRRGIGSAGIEADQAGAVVFARLLGIALVLWLGYWLLITHVH